MAGVGSEGALGSAGMAGAIRQMIVDRLTQAQAAQEMRQRNEQMVLAQRGADRADRALDQQDELKRLVMTQNADLKDQSALDTLVTQGAFSKGQELSPSTAARFQRHGLGDLAQEQQSLPSTQLQGGVRMPQILGRVIQPSGAMGPEQGDASSGAVTATPQSPMKTGRVVFAGTGKQADTTAERERKIQADKEKADNAAALADVRERLATVAENKPQTQPGGFQLVPEIDPKTGQQTGRFFSYNTKTNSWSTVAGQGPAATRPAPGAAQAARTPYQAAENAAGLNTAEVEGVKVLKALRQTGLDQSNDPADPRWQKFVVATLKMAPEDYQKADIQQRAAFVNAALTRQLMGGRPSQYVAELIQQHLPQGQMTGQQLTHVLHNVLQQTTERRTELKQMLPGIKGPISGQGYEDYLTELANGANGQTQVGGFTVKVK